MNFGIIQKPDGPISAVAQLFFDHQAGSISARDYSSLTAAWVTQNMHEFPIQPYSPVPTQSRSYIEGRLAGRQEYSHEQAKVLGNWFNTVTEQKKENDHNLSFFAWCIGELEQVKLDHQDGPIRKAADRLMMLQFPFDWFNKALQVKAKDAEARRWRG